MGERTQEAFWLLAAIMFASTTTAARPIDVETLIGLENVTDVALSPDGRNVAYAEVRSDAEANEYAVTIRVVDVDGTDSHDVDLPRPVMRKPYPNIQLAWSPDGQFISFLGDDDGSAQTFVVRPDGSGGRQLTDWPGGISSYTWAPSAEAISFIAHDTRDAGKNSTAVIRVGLDRDPPRLWVRNLDDGPPRAVSGKGHFVYAADWSPDGGQLVYSAADDGNFMSLFKTGLYVVADTAGEPRELVPPAGANLNPIWSPDGRWIAFIRSGGEESIMAVQSLAIVPAAGGTVRDLTRRYDYFVSQGLWNPDSDLLFFTSDSGTSGPREGMFAQNLYRTSLDGTVDVLMKGEHVISELAIDCNGSRLAYKVSNATSMGDVYIRALPDGGERKLTTVNPVQKELDWGTLTSMKWESFDGAEIWGLFLFPPGYTEADGPLPVLVYVHGGPVGGFRFGVYPQFTHTIAQFGPYPVQALASSGIGVFLPNPRGGIGYGEAGLRAIIGAWGDVDYRDIETGVDALVRRGIADPDRLGVAGGSYGGYMTNWIVTQTDRYRAASSWAGIGDIADLFALSDAGAFTLDYFGSPWSSGGAYRAQSPLEHSAAVDTPLLLQHGQDDRRVPTSQALEFFKYLEGQEKAVCLELYPGNGHVTWEPAMQREVQRRNLEWFRGWLLADDPSAQIACP